MKDNSFISMTTDEMISKINIDPRLVKAFKNVMKKIQNYFNDHGYTSERNYKAFLERYLINSSNLKLRIEVAPSLGNELILGGYVRRFINDNLSSQNIIIREDIVNGDENELEHVLCHEFIHFLVHIYNMENNKYSELETEDFIDEALTEMLTQQIYSKGKSYEPQVRLHSFANILSGNENNFSLFLRGYVDCKETSPQWYNYLLFTRKFSEKFNAGKFKKWSEVYSDKDYLGAQRQLISLFINKTTRIEEYCDVINKLLYRPALDEEFIKKQINDLDYRFIWPLINRLKQKELFESFLKEKLAEVRNYIEILYQIENDNVYSFKFLDKIFIFDKEGNIYGDKNDIVINKSNGKIELKSKDNQMIIELNKLKFIKKDKLLKSVINDYFAPDIEKHLSMIEKSLLQEGELIKLEEFILPTIDIYKKKSNRKVYVATYKDKIIILDNTLSIENVYNLSNYKHNGLVGTEGKYLLWQDKLDDIKSGIIYSFLTEKVIVTKILQSIEDEIEDNITDEELKKIIENNNPEENVDDVILKLARLKYESLSDDEKSKLYKKVVDNNMKFVLSVENGLINVSLLNGDESYQGERKVLYDSNNLGIYNELIDILKKEKIDYTNDIDSIVYEVNGNIITRSEYLYNQQSNKKSHVEVIESLEKLLNISITPILSLKLDSNTNMPTPIYKDTNMLQEECRIILVGLDQLYDSNKIDYEMYMMFKNEVRLEYTDYINMVDSIDNNINNTLKK